MHPYPITRPIQTVAVQASPAANDLIQPMAYNTLGRQIKGYLPYAGKTTDVTGSYRPNAISTDQPNFYNQTGQYLIPTDSDPYAQQVFDNSPLQRVLEAGQVGNGFQPGQHYKAVTYRYNTSADTVWIWSNTGTHTGGNNYAVNTLSVTDGKDEDNVETLVFTDMLGRAILKRQLLGANHLDTYYIYDNSGMLIDMLPPLAVAKMKSSGNYSLTQSGISALVFSYVYDNKGRLNQKNLPGKVVINIIYDPLSRPVLMRDANLAANHQWNYIKYDVKGRAVSQGIYTDNNDTTSTQMQAYVNGLSSSYSTAWYESRSTSANNNGYYTDNIFPTGTVTGTSISPLAYEYFDNYTLTTGTTYSYHTTGLAGELGATSAQIKGMPTMVQKSMVGSGMTAKWLISVVFYDHNLRTIQTQTNNILYYQTATTITDTTTTVPDFVGAATVSKQVKITGTGSTNKASVQTTLTYDQVHRVTAIDQSYNGTSTVHIAQYVYNELGQVVQKKLGETSTGWLQNVDFRYNIRGQLLYINNSKLANDTGKTNSDTNDLFGMQLLYDQTDSNLGNTPYYSGRLSAVKWMSKDGSNNSSYERAFKYYYDAVDRDTAAIYAERPATSTSAFTTTHGWDENRITYDQNGNLLTLFRDSTSQGSGGHTPIDNLTYTYSNTYPNQLSTVSDATHNSSGFVGGTGTYTYDANGNLTNEPYKGLSHLYYNALNRTDKITFTSSANRYITYIYDANGTLIRKMQYDNVGGVATLMYTTDYIDGFVYITAGTGSPALSYVQMPEGRSLYNGSGFTQEYVIGDHQGNTRICFNNTGAEGTAQVVQENSYYAFGMIMPGSTVGTSTTPNKNLYNGGSEWQNDYSNLPDYYQTYNRNYDAALGRFVSVDPDPESAESMSNYQYAGNMPMMFNDPDGARFTTPQYAGNNGTANLQNEESEFESSVSELDVLNEIAYWSYSGNWDGGGADYSGFWNALLGQVFGPRDNYNYLDFDSQAMDQLYIHYNEVGDGNFRLGFINSRIVEAVAPESDKEQQSSGQTAGLPGGMNSSDDQSGIFSYASDVSYGDGGLTGNAAFQIASYKPFTIWSVAKGFLVDVSSDASDDIPGLTPATASSTVTVSTVSAGRYEVAARVNLHFENSQWVLTTTAYYIGAKIDNMFFTTSTSELVNGVYYNSHHIERSAGDDTVLPTGWTYLGRTRYYFPNNNPWGNFGLYVHVGVGIWHFEGNEAGSGYIDIVVPITK